MPLTFPLPLDEFFDDLPIGAGEIDLSEALEMSETGKGEILTASIGERLWTAKFEIASCSYEEADAIKARLDTLRYPGRSLFVRPTPSIGPVADRDGLIMGVYEPKINTVESNNRVVLLEDLPPNYALNNGDFFSYQYGSNPIRYALHQICNGFEGYPGGGSIIEVSSFVQPGWEAGVTLIELIRPFFKAVLVPGSVNPGRKASQRVEGIAFSLIQTFR
jgi:hypothetical protein